MPDTIEERLRKLRAQKSGQSIEERLAKLRAQPPQPQPEGIFSSFQTGVAGPLLRNVVETAADVYNAPGETLERAGRAGLEFLSAFDPAGNAYEATVKSQAPRVAELNRRADERLPEPIQSMKRGMAIEEARPRTRAGRVARGVGSVLGEVAFPTAPESAAANITTLPFAGAAVKMTGQAFRAGINSVRRAFGKGAAQVIEAEALPAATAQVRQSIGDAPVSGVSREVAPAATQTIEPPTVGAREGILAPETTQPVDTLQSVFAKLRTDDIDQIGEMFANANRRFNKTRTVPGGKPEPRTPEATKSSFDDYDALNKLTLEERRALGQVLPARTFAPVVETPGVGRGGRAQGIEEIPESEQSAQLYANLRELSEFFDAQGRQSTGSGVAERMAAMARTPTSPVSVTQLRGEFPDLTKKQFDDEMIRLSESGDISLMRHDAPGQLSAAQKENMVKVGNDYHAAATVRGPSVSAAPMNVSAARATPSEPPFFSVDDPWEPPWARDPRRAPLFQEPTPAFGTSPPMPRQPGAAPGRSQQLFDAAARSPWQDTTLAYFRSNLLTNPVSRAIDLGQTVINQFADAVIRPVAAAVDVVVSKLTGKRSITGPSLSGTGRAIGSIPQGLRDAREVLRTGRQAIDSGADDVLYGSEIRSGLGKGVDVPVNGVFRLLGALDAPFRRFGYARNLFDRAKVAALNEVKRGRVPKGQLSARIRELMDKDDIIKAAVRDGERSVYSESNQVSAWVASQTRNSPNARLAFGLLQPFLRIPLNAALKAADFAGVGGVKALYKVARGVGRKARGQSFFRDIEEQRVFSQNVAAGSFAPAAFLLGMEMEERGRLEGYFYTSKRDYPNGKVPTSINIGGENYDINRLGGFIAAPLFVGATYNRLRKQDVGKANALLRSFGGLTQQVPGLGHYGAPAKAGRILSADDMTGELTKEAGGVASGFVPASGAMGAVAKAIDPAKKRKAEGFTGPIMDKIPGLRQQLPEKWTGSPIIDAAMEKSRPLFSELQRLNKRVSELRKKDGEAEDAFNARVQQFSQNYTRFGMQLMASPRFQSAPDVIKDIALDRLDQRAKGITHRPLAFPEIELDAELLMDAAEQSKKNPANK